MTDEQRELDRKFYCAIDTLNVEIKFLREHGLNRGNDDLTAADLLESSRNIFTEVHAQWRAHIGDPIVDTKGFIARALLDLADKVQSGRYTV